MPVMTQRTFVPIVIAVCLLLTPAAFATMHFAVVRSTPAAGQAFEVAPKRLQIWFSQAPAAGVSKLSLLQVVGTDKPEKKEIVIGKTEVDKDSKSIFADVPTVPAAGAYILAWKGAGDDGHVLSGEIKFTIAPKGGQ